MIQGTHTKREMASTLVCAVATVKLGRPSLLDWPRKEKGRRFSLRLYCLYP